ncbi:uncharacterized protein CPUR_08542 [Claviceps purpurea 20.1]|uniref:MULE transposase domain-containing protein n=1 Tax=Claviceps purpurea (strain 20.1) TaxID=1111077 RepID=M1WGK2_CLAP2|nr:uncharacterized protein CPUR_08542 [Claviceps purpurea 20.1]
MADRKMLPLLKPCYEVLLFDCTYKTNKFKMPLLNIVAASAMNSTIQVALCLMTSETQVDYEWALLQLRRLLCDARIPLPNVVLTDKDVALINACKDAFPAAKALICRWHVNKNVVAKVMEAFNDAFSDDVICRAARQAGRAVADAAAVAASAAFPSTQAPVSALNIELTITIDAAVIAARAVAAASAEDMQALYEELKADWFALLGSTTPEQYSEVRTV